MEWRRASLFGQPGRLAAASAQEALVAAGNIPFQTKGQRNETACLGTFAYFTIMHRNCPKADAAFVVVRLNPWVAFMRLRKEIPPCSLLDILGHESTFSTLSRLARAAAAALLLLLLENDDDDDEEADDNDDDDDEGVTTTRTTSTNYGSFKRSAPSA
ncbi:unnamed protein product [Soboliphyme baturini]|uniref:Uncharacterized protein n=1 Tax=Soboliphyme baturini TaxID=241478 RepID=A0A183J0A4_9BILA|nr:unnamed protein product [Soboliphyme baturini]